MYKTWRFNVFLGIFIGYAGFYLIRNNVTLVSAILKEHDIMNAVGIGVVANAVLFSYGLSKFFMAMLSDRANARYFMPIGLALSAVMNLLIAFVPALSASIGIFAIVMFINGWFQGMGWPPSGRVLVHWFSTTERGWMTSIWNCAHNVGGAGVGLISAWALQSFAKDDADWSPAFWAPALVVALIAFLLIRDRPEALGLPTIEEYRDDPAKVIEKSESMGWKDMLFKHVLTNRVVVLLAVTNVFVYTLRYGVLSWIPIYLTEQIHGVNVKEGILGFAIYEGAGIIGTLLCGWVSDKVFKGWRSGAGILFLGGVGIALVIYWLMPATAPIGVFYLLIAIIGGLIYGPVMLIGLQAIDLSPKNVAGTAAGFTGLFGYLLGATLASSGVGLLIHYFGWNVAYGFLVAVAVIAVVLMFIVGKDERRLMDAREEALAVVGPSGCGKSTLLLALAGFEDEAAGSILIDGSDETRTEPSRRPTGLVFQTPALFERMTVRENVAFGLADSGLTERHARDLVEATMARMGVATLADRRPANLSGGQAQRVALARVLARRPAVLLLDEPLAHVGAGLAASIRQSLLREVRRLGIATLYVTHDVDEACVVGDRLLLMTNGRVVETGDARDLYFRPGSEQAARLMGIPNVLACEVEGSARSGAALVRLRSASFHVPAPNSTEPGSALVAIPAEAIELEPSADAAIIGRHAQVIGASFVRGSMHYDLEAEFGTLVARAPAPAPAPFSGGAAPVFALGDHVALEIRGGWVLPARR